MEVTLGSNISALKAIGQLQRTTFNLETVFDRLSSGQRINRASDDPAGLSISMSLGAKSRILNRAKMNINDGISLLNIADGATEQISGLLTRMAELAEQSANGTYSYSQRLNLQKEYEQLDQEIRRITETTQFNGLSLLEGSYTTSSFSSVVSLNNGFEFGGASADGRYFVFRPKLTTVDNQFAIFDSELGSYTTIMEANGYDIKDIAITQTGDVVYAATGGGGTNIYYYDKDTQETKKLTDSINTNDAAKIAVSTDGSKVAFTSYTHYTIGGGATSNAGSGNQRIFVLDIVSGKVEGVEQDVGNVAKLKISASGNYVAFESSDDLTGNNSDGNTEIFGFSIGDTTYKQLIDTTSVGSIRLLGVSTNGRAFFLANRDSLDYDPQGTDEFYSVGITDLSLQQYTNFNSNISASITTLNADGTAIYFSFNKNLTGENPNNYNQIFKMNLISGEMSQLTKLTSNVNITGGAISQDGRKVIVETDNKNVFYADISPTYTIFDFEAGNGATGNILVQLQGILQKVAGLGSYTITTQDSARGALDTIKSNIEAIASIRGTIGAAMSRLQSANNTVTSQELESRAAQGRIVDADIAQESANLTLLTIRQQAAAAVLAQANQQPSLVLNLLNNV